MKNSYWALLLLTACSTPNEQTVPNKVPATTGSPSCGIDDLRMYSSVNSRGTSHAYDLLSGTEPVVPEISLFKHQSTFDKDLTPQQLLYKFIPGKQYKGVSAYDTMALNLWICKGCEKEPIRYDGEPSEKLFPYKDINNTLIDTVIRKELNGIQHLFISFYTVNEISPSGTGRFSGTAMGMAIVKQNRDNQQVIAFDPYLGCYGSFQNPIIPQIEYVEDQLFISYVFANGGPGEPYTAYKETFQLSDGQFRQIGNNRFLELFNTNVGAWYTHSKFKSPSENELIITGFINPKKLMETNSWIIDPAYSVLKDWVNKHRSEDRCYRFSLTVTEKMVSGSLTDTGKYVFTVEPV